MSLLCLHVTFLGCDSLDKNMVLHLFSMSPFPLNNKDWHLNIYNIYSLMYLSENHVCIPSK